MVRDRSGCCDAQEQLPRHPRRWKPWADRFLRGGYGFDGPAVDQVQLDARQRERRGKLDFRQLVHQRLDSRQSTASGIEVSPAGSEEREHAGVRHHRDTVDCLAGGPAQDLSSLLPATQGHQGICGIALVLQTEGAPGPRRTRSVCAGQPGADRCSAEPTELLDHTEVGRGPGDLDGITDLGSDVRRPGQAVEGEGGASGLLRQRRAERVQNMSLEAALRQSSCLDQRRPRDAHGLQVLALEHEELRPEGHDPYVLHRGDVSRQESLGRSEGRVGQRVVASEHRCFTEAGEEARRPAPGLGVGRCSCPLRIDGLDRHPRERECSGRVAGTRPGSGRLLAHVHECRSGAFVCPGTGPQRDGPLTVDRGLGVRKDPDARLLGSRRLSRAHGRRRRPATSALRWPTARAPPRRRD